MAWGKAWILALLVAWLGADTARAGEPAWFEIQVDASNLDSGLVTATSRIPVKPGPLTLHYPKWLPGLHSRATSIEHISGLRLRVQGQPVQWKRAPKDAWTFHCVLPSGADTLTVELAFAIDMEQRGLSDGETRTTGALALIVWSDLLLYPSGWDLNATNVRPQLRIPNGWKTASALDISAAKAGAVEFEPVSLNVLADSPVIAGAFLRRVRIPTAGSVPHWLSVAADEEGSLELPENLLKRYGAAIDEVQAVLGEPPVPRYEFLLALSDRLVLTGREHSRCCVLTAPERAFTGRAGSWTADGFVHEYVHVWNGRLSLPKGMAVQSFQERPDFRLLWIYEGLTTYLAHVFLRRAGVWSDSEFKADIARTASGVMWGRAERWRSLEDICSASVVKDDWSLPWTVRRRGQDYYRQAELVWFEIDCRLRAASGGKVTLDDFVGQLFGTRGGRRGATTYDFEDVVKTLTELRDEQWPALFERRVFTVDKGYDLDWLRRCGWKLGYEDGRPWSYPPYRSDPRHAPGPYMDLRHSVGIEVAADGTVLDLVPGSPADKAGLGPGMVIRSVNGRDFRLARLYYPVREGWMDRLLLVADRGEKTRRITVDYRKAHQVPVLSPAKGEVDQLEQITRARRKSAER